MLNKIRAALRILRGVAKEQEINQARPNYGYEIVVKHPESGLISFEGVVWDFKLEQNNQRLYIALHRYDPSDRLLVFLTGEEQIFIHRLQDKESHLDRAPMSSSNSFSRHLMRNQYDFSF